MRSYTVPQIKPISGSDPIEAALLFNEAIMQLAPMNPTYKQSEDGCMYWIFYKVEYTEAETLAEEHELKGEHHKCHECPHCVRDLNRFGDIDARKVWATCAKTGKRTRINLEVCDEYYKERG